MDRTKTTISQHYSWTNPRDDTRTHLKVCNTCNRNKKQNVKYIKLIANKGEAIQQDRLSVYLIGPHKVRREGHEDPLILKLQYLCTTRKMNSSVTRSKIFNQTRESD